MTIVYGNVIDRKFNPRSSHHCSFAMQDKAQNAVEDADGSIKKNFNKATDIAQNIGKDVQRNADNVGDSACDTARNMKRCRIGC